MSTEKQQDYLKREKLIDIIDSFPEKVDKTHILTILETVPTDLRYPFEQFKSPSESVYLRCDDGAEVVVFTRHDWNAHETDFEITIEDNYCGYTHASILGRIKRAWNALIGKPLSYTGVYSQGREHMEEFLNKCVELMNKERVEE